MCRRTFPAFRNLLLGVIVSLASSLLTPALAVPISLDFGAFYAEPGAPVVIEAGGHGAVLTEDPQLFVNYLSNIPGLGDPVLIEGGAGRSLVFDYEFLEPAGNDDIFHVALLDGLTGSVLPAYESFFYSSGSGQVTFDLADFAGITLGLQFELVAGLLDADFSSQLSLSGLTLIVPDDPVAVPEPGSLVLMLLGLASIGSRCFQRLRLRH